MARNPFRSEAEAYRFLLLTVGYFALIVVAAAIATWLGVVVFVVLTVAVLWLWLRSRTDEPPAREVIPSRSADDERRILVVANETVGGSELLAILQEKAEGVNERVLVVCPALNSQVRHWASDEDAARAAAQSRLDASLARLRSEGVQASGEVGDGDPLQAIEDALRTFGADEIVISTHPEGRSNWLERNVVGAARDRFEVPITHVVVDLEAAQS
ncbi:MAG TPA: universal stress protein [Gaiellaceae bacterium]|jgi:membrane protein implicated in regulation of membrane protease activity